MEEAYFELVHGWHVAPTNAPAYLARLDAIIAYRRAVIDALARLPFDGQPEFDSSMSSAASAARIAKGEPE